MKQLSIRKHLQNHIGTQQWYRHGLFKDYLYTEGVRDMATMCKANWMVSDILVICATVLKKESFLSIEIQNQENQKGMRIVYTDGNENILFRQEYSDTDYPLFNITEDRVTIPGLVLFKADTTLMLTSEY